MKSITSPNRTRSTTLPSAPPKISESAVRLHQSPGATRRRKVMTSATAAIETRVKNQNRNVPSVSAKRLNAAPGFRVYVRFSEGRSAIDSCSRIERRTSALESWSAISSAPLIHVAARAGLQVVAIMAEGDWRRSRVVEHRDAAPAERGMAVAPAHVDPVRPAARALGPLGARDAHRELRRARPKLPRPPIERRRLDVGDNEDRRQLGRVRLQELQQRLAGVQRDAGVQRRADDLVGARPLQRAGDLGAHLKEAVPL